MFWFDAILEVFHICFWNFFSWTKNTVFILGNVWQPYVGRNVTEKIIIFCLSFSCAASNFREIRNNYYLCNSYPSEGCLTIWPKLRAFFCRKKNVKIQPRTSFSINDLKNCFDSMKRLNIFVLLVSTHHEIVAQSICTNYSCFENMGRFVTLKKKSDPKYGPENHKVTKTQTWPCFLLPAFFRSLFWTWYFLSSRP